MIIDGRGESGAVPRAFDVCVVGAGPAGLSIATRLAERGLQVAILEAGGLRPTMRNQRMLVDRPSGSPYWDLQNVRVRVFGGSGSRWGGISRPLDPIDFVERPWVDDSGWPIDWTDLEPYFEQAAALLELPPPRVRSRSGERRVRAGALRVEPEAELRRALRRAAARLRRAWSCC